MIRDVLLHRVFPLMRPVLHVVVLACCSLQLPAQEPSTVATEHVRAAQRAQSVRDCATAAREYRLAVQLVPRSAELQSNEGVALYCNGQMSEAADAFQRALAIKPSLFSPHLFLGLVNFKQGNEGEAVKELEKATRLGPSDPTAHLWLGLAYVAADRYEEAIPQFNATLKVNPQDPDAQYALGQCWFELGRRKALELAKLAPNGAYLLRLAAEQRALMAGVQQGRAFPTGAISPKQDLPAAGSDPKQGREALLYTEARDAEQKAQDALSAVLRDTPDSYRAHQILADIALSGEQLDEAVAEYRKVLELNPGLPGVHEAISNCLMRQYHPAEALAELRAEQSLQPRSGQVMTEIARVQLDMGSTQEASESLHKAVALGADSATTFVLLGKVALRMDNAPGAIDALTKAIAKDPEVSAAYYLLARAYRATGNRAAMNEALKTYRQKSQDEQERQSAERALRKPDTAPPLMDAEEKQDAAKLAEPDR